MSGFSRRHFLTLAGAAALTGCGQRGQFSVASTPSPEAGIQRLLVATTRAADPAPIAYGSGRAETLDFARLAISIPPTHRIGNIEWPSRRSVDPARHFALVGADTLPDIEALVRAARSTAGDDEAVLFVHGYNNNFAEGVYRHAQIAWDYEMRGPQIHFAWPSAGRPLEYTYDRDSTLIARDALVTLLLRLLGDRGLSVSLVGHSMGGFLIMEALRQIALTGRRESLRSLVSTTLISPDIELDLFRSQAAALGGLPQPFIVAAAENDRLLRLSSSLSGGTAKLGAVRDLDQLEGLGVFVVDMTALADAGTNHFLPGTSPAVIALIKGLREVRPAPNQTIAVGPVSITLGADGLLGGDSGRPVGTAN
ncbi:MAG: alpha/beta fold hydrolase [Rhodobacteraceae bacterium]|nr:alpha/beta fold hydrolase [Silicimonas sp.]RZW07488.1 MAG: alpha/beta fold hydrolase [Paracoccaceae bacterium]